MLIPCTCLRTTLIRLAGSHLRREPGSRLNNHTAQRPLVRAFSHIICGAPVPSATKAGKQLLQLKERLRLLRFRSSQLGRTEPEKAKVHIKRRDMMRLMDLAKNEKLLLAAALVCLVISSGITMSVPFALGRILDIIFSEGEENKDKLKRLRDITFMLFGVFVIGGLANYGRVYTFNAAALNMVRDLRMKLYRHMLLQEASWFDTKGSGELLNRLINDTFFMANSLSQNLSDGLRSAAMITIGAGMMVYTSPQLAAVSAAVVPCIAGMAIVYGRYVRSITRQMLDKYAGVSKYAEERLSNAKTVKIFCKECQEINKFNTLLADAVKLGEKEVLARSIFYGLTGFSGNVIIVSVLFYGGNLVVSDAITIGSLASFILYAAYSAVSINGLSNFYTELNKGVGAAQRVWEILDRQQKIRLDEGIYPKQKPRGDIIFENVTFYFPTRPESAVLSNFNLRITPGTTTAIVGRSGAGKTTVGTLLLRLYDPQQGRILMDSNDLREVRPHWLRCHIGTVSQEPVLFSGTIRENILYGLDDKQTVNEQDLLTAVREANVDQFTNNLPDGLNTVVGERGMMLSGGQKQRVAIARALIRNPSILILDEATSALDALSEQLVQNAIEQAAKGRTVLTIAHRLSTIRDADKIVVIENGRNIEEGSYEELLGNDKGTFKELIRNQTFVK